MMSSRLLRADAEAHDADAHGSRGGFYGRLDDGYARLLGLSDAPPRRRSPVIAAVVVLSSVPLYHAVKQEFIPTNVDEAEFEVNVTAPRGHEPRRDERGHDRRSRRS